MKKLMAVWLVLALLLASCGAATAEKEITDIRLTETAEGLAYSFRCASRPYLLLQYKDADESGKLVLTGKDGLYEGVIALSRLQTANQLKVTIRTTSESTLYETTVALKNAKAPAKLKADKGAAGKVTDLTLTPGEREMSFSFTAQGHHQVRVVVSSVLQKMEYLLNEQEDGVFSDTLKLPCVNARDLVTITIQSVTGKQLAKAQERTLFVPPDVGETAAEGPLKGVKVCIDPGHQALPVYGGRVYIYPGSTKLVSGGSNGMAQGKSTLRKESICVLEISYRICRMMRALGAEVVMTRWIEEVSIKNMERADYANEQKADYCFRIHLNANDKPNSKGIYVYGPLNSPYAREALPFEQYRDTAQTILDAMLAATGVQGGTVRMRDQFIGNNWAKMPTFLLECGFLTTPSDDWMLTTDDYQDKIARGVTDGLVAVVEGRLSHFESH